jgi:UDP-N-acetylmuramoyl-L-alanyl-D-glutamate--2,6-diaminopimelate ligase
LKLKEILEELPFREIKGDANPDISGISYDSRRVLPGGLFVAVKGQRHDGLDFVADAVGRGAVAVVAEQVSAAAAAVPQIVVDDARRALAAAATAFYRHPGREFAVVGVTGTNGKTTVAFLLDGIFRAAGYKTALASTVKNVVAGEERPARLTTAEAPELQAMLREAADASCDVAVVEVSSHAMTLSRVAGTPFAAAAFTNLSHDHLDLHGDMDAYFAAKASLFWQLVEGAPAVVNVDDPYGARLAASLPGRVVTYGRTEAVADYRAADASSGWDGLRFSLGCPDGETVTVTSPLHGSFDVLNCTAAFAVAREMGVAAAVALKGLAETPPVPGRLELVDVNDKLRVVIDYAHSPDSMEKVLAEIRGLGAGRIVVVFGCTGDRDVEKRPVMGALAHQYADYAVVTTDDPYYEDPAAIARDVAAGIVAEGGTEADDYRVILDRGEAIRFALSTAPADRATVVAVLGKGHEEVQKVKGSAVPFSDRRTVEELVTELGLAAPSPA